MTVASDARSLAGGEARCAPRLAGSDYFVRISLSLRVMRSRYSSSPCLMMTSRRVPKSSSVRTTGGRGAGAAARASVASLTLGSSAAVRRRRCRAGPAGPAGEVLELRREAPEEQHRLGALAEDAGEGDEPHHPELVRGVRGVDAALQVAVQLARVAAHPPAVPREQRDGAEDHDERDDVG